jgi:putative phage-type endonuclease
MPKLINLDQGSDDWLIWRQNGLGASDAPIVLELSPFKTAYQLWLEKTGLVKPKPQSAAMAHGHTTEPLVRERYIAETGKQIVPVAAVYDDEDAPYIRASVDGWNAETRHLVEIKCPMSGDSHRDAREGTVPDHYWMQIQHEMAVMDALTCDYVSYFNGDMVVIPVERNEEIWLSEILPAEMEFMRRVQEKSWPKPEGEARDDSEEWQKAARNFLDGKSMTRVSADTKRRGEAALRRMATAKVTRGAGIRASWVAYKARFEVKISADTEESLGRIMDAVRPLEGRQGVGKISTTTWAPNLVLRVAEDADAD